MAVRGDLIFSNWIFIWFIVYYFGFIQYSPIWLLLVGALENIYLLGLMIVNQLPYICLIHFSIILFLFKLLPIYLIRNDTLKIDDLIFSLLLVNLYIAWTIFNRKDVIQVSNEIVTSLIQNKRDTPMMNLLDNIQNKFKGYFI